MRRAFLLAAVGALLCAGLFLLSSAVASRPLPTPVAGDLGVGPQPPASVPAGPSPAGDALPMPPPAGGALPPHPSPPPPAPASEPLEPDVTDVPSAEPTAASEPAVPDDARPEPFPEEGSAGLEDRLLSLLADPELADTPLSVSILDADGQALLSERSHEPLLPASTQKLVTAAAALLALEPDFRYVTRVHATAPVEPDGTVRGDLVVVGSGDPTLATAMFGTRVDPDRPHTPLETLADFVAASGVRQVTGRVLGDPTVFADEPVPEGWPERYLTQLHAGRVSGLTVNAGRAITERGGQLLGQPAADPAADAAAELHRLLAERGVSVAQGASATRARTSRVVGLGHVVSPPLVELLRHTVQHSDNHMADALFRTLGVAAGEPTWAGSARAAAEALEPLGLDWTAAVLADGSGLSRADRLTAAQLAGLQWRMSVSPAGERWQELMAVSGESGTLRRRLQGTVAERRLRGKTGTLVDVRTLAGTIVGPDDRRYHFAVLGNGLQGPAVQAVRRLQDGVVLALAEHLYGCVWEPAPPALPWDPDGPQPTPDVASPTGPPPSPADDDPAAAGQPPPEPQLVCAA